MIRIALRVAAFACGLGIALPCWAQTTPVSQFPPSQTVDWPLHTIGGAIRLYDINGNVIGGAAHPVMVQCPDGTVNCFGAGTAGFTQTDEAAFTAGVSAFGPGGGLFQTSATSNPLTNGQIGAFQVTSTRSLFTNLRNAAGTEIGTAAAPVQVSLANTATNATGVSVAQSGAWTVQPGNSQNTTGWLVEQGCAGQTIANTTATPINSAGSSANLKLVSKVSAKKVYICSINLVAGAATNVALVEGTKTTNECDTSTAGLAGGATSATGWNLAANGGVVLGSGTGLVAKTASTNTDVCLLFSAGNQVSGTIVWAQF